MGIYLSLELTKTQVHTTGKRAKSYKQLWFIDELLFWVEGKGENNLLKPLIPEKPKTHGFKVSLKSKDNNLIDGFLKSKPQIWIFQQIEVQQKS